MGTLVRNSISAGVAVVTRDNPPVNATSMAVTSELRGVLSELRATPRLRAVIITGAGSRSFGAGSDLRELTDLLADRDALARKLTLENDAFSQLAHFPVPVIAALNGDAFGGGLELALACDLIIAERGQRVGFPEVRLGLFPASGGPVRAMRRIGEGRTRQMIYLGTPVTTEQAHGWGLVDQLVGAGDSLSAAMEVAGRFAIASASGLVACKQSLLAATEADDAAQVRHSLALSETTFSHPDVREGVRAFLARDSPRFSDRYPSSGFCIAEGCKG